MRPMKKSVASCEWPVVSFADELQKNKVSLSRLGNPCRECLPSAESHVAAVSTSTGSNSDLRDTAAGREKSESGRGHGLVGWVAAKELAENGPHTTRAKTNIV